jgi:hypothetical protein
MHAAEEETQRLRAELDGKFGEFVRQDAIGLESCSSIAVHSEGSWLPEIVLL